MFLSTAWVPDARSCTKTTHAGACVSGARRPWEVGAHRSQRGRLGHLRIRTLDRDTQLGIVVLGVPPSSTQALVPFPLTTHAQGKFKGPRSEQGTLGALQSNSGKVPVQHRALHALQTGRPKASPRHAPSMGSPSPVPLDHPTPRAVGASWQGTLPVP